MDEVVQGIEAVDSVVNALGDNATSVGGILALIATGIAGSKKLGGQRFKTLIGSLPVIEATLRKVGETLAQLCTALADIVKAMSEALPAEPAM